MFGINFMAWNGGDLEKLEVLQNRVGRLALGPVVKAVLNYKVRIERMENKRWVKRIFEWSLSESLWEKICWGHVRKLKIQKTVCVRIGRTMDDWLLRGHGGKGMEWDCNKWKKEITKTNKRVWGNYFNLVCQ
ncbi:hypothetical protein FHG87_014091 [Trinorchestia longiramus]|nr:hypothetical protein FHG87_014091 [Trinorchestia longiramus]